jgi:prenyltransferase beta subunit
VRLDESLLKRGIELIVTDIDRGLSSYSQEEWFGSAFLAAALRIFSEVNDRSNADKCVLSLLESQQPTGDFCGPATNLEGSRVPSEWHTAQAIIALSKYDGVKTEKIAGPIDKACNWLAMRQRENGSWGVQEPPYSMYSTTFTGYAVIALAAGGDKFSSGISKSLKWLRGQQISSGAFGDLGSCVMAMAAFQALRGPAFALEIPIPMFLRIQTALSSGSPRAPIGGSGV